MSDRGSFGPPREAARRALEGFGKAYGGGASGLVRAPGRVNLIGEHIDYCGLTVLPMALQRAVWFAYRPREDPRIRVATDAPGLVPCAFEVSREIPPGPTGEWGNYVRAAIQTVASSSADIIQRGFDAFVAADLPIAAGLSSSSALVVASALAWSEANGVPVGSREELATRLAEGERYVGTAGGGMDQAACLLGRAGHALAIDFAPLSVRPIPIPPDWRFVIAHSGRAAEKSGAAQNTYNARTREVARAASLVARVLGEENDEAGSGWFPWLLDRYPIHTLVAAGREALTGVELRRFRHIVTEHERVTRAIDAVRDADVADFGETMLASHASLRDDYDVSTPGLDALVGAAMTQGAAGARLTGAGLGGCGIVLCHAAVVERVLSAMVELESGHSGPRVAFVARAADGAGVVRAAESW